MIAFVRRGDRLHDEIWVERSVLRLYIDEDGVAPQCSMTFAVATKVSGVVITSSPGPTPRALSARCNAAVPEFVPTACLGRHTTRNGIETLRLGTCAQPAGAQRVDNLANFLFADQRGTEVIGSASGIALVAGGGAAD